MDLGASVRSLILPGNQGKMVPSVEEYEATVFPPQTMKQRKLPGTRAGNNLQGLVSINLTLPMRLHLLKTHSLQTMHK